MSILELNKYCKEKGKAIRIHKGYTIVHGTSIRIQRGLLVGLFNENYDWYWGGING